jgi:hypothetical protein
MPPSKKSTGSKSSGGSASSGKLKTPSTWTNMMDVDRQAVIDMLIELTQ